MTPFLFRAIYTFFSTNQSDQNLFNLKKQSHVKITSKSENMCIGNDNLALNLHPKRLYKTGVCKRLQVEFTAA